MQRLIAVFFLLAVAFTLFGQDPPAQPQTPTPLDEKQQLVASQALNLLQSAQQALRNSEPFKVFNDRQAEYERLVQELREATGAPRTCNLSIRQEWITRSGTPCVIAAPATETPEPEQEATGDAPPTPQ